MSEDITVKGLAEPPRVAFKCPKCYDAYIVNTDPPRAAADVKRRLDGMRALHVRWCGLGKPTP